MNKARMVRVNEEILKEVSKIIGTELKDPRVSSMTTVTRVDTTSDLKHCKIYVGILGDAAKQKEALEGLKNAGGFIRKQLAATVNLRNTPMLQFVLDDSVEYSLKIGKLIDQANKNQEGTAD